MKKIKVTLTEDMIKLISCFNFNEFTTIENDDERQEVYYGLDLNSLYGGNFLFEDMSRILGFYDRAIEDTQFDPMGPRFSKEDEDYMFQTHSYIVENITYIEQILHQYCWRGGITPGTYVAKDYELIWYKEENKK